ncbi:MAG: hypothetical protein AAB546_01290 [Patescibacteria group bacterium]
MDNNNQTQPPKQQVPAIVVTAQRTEKISTANPLVYIKYWWKRIMAHEGTTIKITAKPVTVFGVALIAFSLAFGLGGVVLPFAFPWIKVKSNSVVVQQSPTPTPADWRETAIKGTLKKTSTIPVKFFLLTSSDEAVTLQIPENLNLTTLVGRRILATGSYNAKQKLLIVSDVQDLEVLPTTPVPIPTATATPIQTPVPTTAPTETPTIAPTSTPGTPDPTSGN